MAERKSWTPMPGDWVALTEIPPGLLQGLPSRDQVAIRAMLGKRILLNEYDSDGRAELVFKDRHGAVHFVYVEPTFIKRWQD